MVRHLARVITHLHLRASGSQSLKLRLSLNCLASFRKLDTKCPSRSRLSRNELHLCYINFFTNTSLLRQSPVLHLNPLFTHSKPPGDFAILPKNPTLATFARPDPARKQYQEEVYLCRSQHLARFLLPPARLSSHYARIWESRK